MSVLRNWKDRLMGKSVRDLAEEVDLALGRLAQAQGLEATAQDGLRLAQQDVERARGEVAAARDALFNEHPELRGGEPTVTEQQPTSPEGYEVVEVDDPDDPRFTSGVSAVSADDNSPLPPITWNEHDDV